MEDMGESLREMTKRTKERAKTAIKDAKDFSTSTQKILNVDKITTEEDRLKYIKKGVEIFDQLYQTGKKRTTQTFQDAERIRREIEAWVGPEWSDEYQKNCYRGAKGLGKFGKWVGKGLGKAGKALGKFGDWMGGIVKTGWEWTKEALQLGAHKYPTTGVLAQEVKELYPEAVIP